MRATLHLISAGLMMVVAAGSYIAAHNAFDAGQSPDFHIGGCAVYASAAIANLICAFKE